MKKISKEDLSLDKQVVSNLTGGSDTNDKTDNELICASKVCTDSHFEICCAPSNEASCGMTCELSRCISCNESDDETGCPISYDPDTTCLTPLPETKICPE